MHGDFFMQKTIPSIILNPVIQQEQTGKKLKQILQEKHVSVKYLQENVFGFEYPQAIYNWLNGKTLPNIDNFLKLATYLEISIEDILVYNNVV